MSVRIAFDVSLPVFVSRDARIGGELRLQDEPLLWRELGISEDVLRLFYTSGLVYFTASGAATASEQIADLEIDARSRPLAPDARKKTKHA